ncbi:MAG: hypothetical protein AAGA33_12740 [Pseudomonadota bacterium]
MERAKMGNAKPVKVWMLAVSSVLVLLTVASYAWILAAVPAFIDLYAGFGTELPTLTRLVLSYSRFTIPLALIAILPLISILRYRRTGSTNTSRNFWQVVLGFAISQCIGGITVAGLYLPILAMGQVVR